jgi:hypothetical protein
MMKPKLCIGTRPNSRERIYLPLDELAHTLVSGATRYGKTFFVLDLVRQLWRLKLRGYKCGTIVIDPHGDFHEDLLGYAWTMGLGREVVLFEPGPQWTPCLNPLRSSFTDLDVPSLVLRAIQRACDDLYPDQMPRLQRHLRALVRLLVDKQCTLLEGYDVLHDDEVRRTLVDTVGDDRLRMFWEHYDDLAPRLQAERIESVENRIDRLVASSQVMQRILGAADSSIDIGQVLDQGKILLIDLGRTNLTDEQRRLIASLLINTIFEYAMRRPRGRRTPCYVICDEAGDLLNADRDLPRALAQSAKYGVYWTLIVQMLAQLAEVQPILKSAVLSCCTTRFCFGGSREDAEILGPELFTGEFHKDERKLELTRLIYRYREETRTVHSEAEAEGEAQVHSSVHSHMGGSGSTFGGGSGSSATYDFLGAGGLATETLTSSGFDGQSEFSADGYAEGEAHGTTRSSARGRSVVPFLRPIEDRELASVQFRSPEEIRERYVAMLKRQAPRHLLFQNGHHRTAVPARTNYVKLFDVPPTILNRFRLDIYRRTGCQVPTTSIDGQIDTRRAGLRRPVEIAASTGAPLLPGKFGPSPTEALLASANTERMPQLETHRIDPKRKKGIRSRQETPSGQH